MENTPTIRTERLILRRFTLDDTEAFFSIMSNEEVNTFLPLFPLRTEAAAREHLTQSYLKSYQKPMGFRYAICLDSDNIPIGYVHVGDGDSYNFGYALKQMHWGKGIVTEACRAVVGQLKKAAIPYITATHDINNSGSGNIMKKIGMTYCYTYEEQWQPKNILVTFRMYQLNLRESDAQIYKKYWDMYSVHYVEKDV